MTYHLPNRNTAKSEFFFFQHLKTLSDGKEKPKEKSDSLQEKKRLY